MGSTSTTTTRPSLMSRLRGRKARRTTTKRSSNPITGKTTTTTKSVANPHHTHATSTHHKHAISGTSTKTAAHHHRKPSKYSPTRTKKSRSTNNIFPSHRRQSQWRDDEGPRKLDETPRSKGRRNPEDARHRRKRIAQGLVKTLDAISRL